MHIYLPFPPTYFIGNIFIEIKWFLKTESFKKLQVFEKDMYKWFNKYLTAKSNKTTTLNNVFKKPKIVILSPPPS